MIYNEVKVCYTRQTGEDNAGVVREAYLVESVNCADAENRVIEYIKPYVFDGTCETPQIRRRKFYDIFPNPTLENWYEAKVEFIDTDVEKESRKAWTLLIQANNVMEAARDIKFHLASIDHEVVAIKKSAILDVIRM